MSYLFDGINDAMTGTFSSTYADPLTIALWVKVADYPAFDSWLFYLGADPANQNSTYRISAGGGDNQWLARTLASTGAAGTALVTSNIDGVWTPMVGVFSGDSLRDIYVGTIGNTAQNTSTAAAADTINDIRVGSLGQGPANWFAGRLAELAAWNKSLTTQEITDYLAGNAASGIAAANNIGYWPLSASAATQLNLGVDAGGDLTVSGATFDADHPTITGGSVFVPRSMLLGVG